MHTTLKAGAWLVGLSLLVGCADFGKLDADRQAYADERDAAIESRERINEVAVGFPAGSAEAIAAANAIAELNRIAKEADDRIQAIDLRVQAAIAEEGRWLSIGEAVAVLATPWTGGISLAIAGIAGTVVNGRRERRKGAEIVADSIAVGRAASPELDAAFGKLSPEQVAAMHKLLGGVQQVVTANRKAGA
jgi:hypothetical protein